MPAGAGGLRIVPGLLDEPPDGAPDVMRGEETQIFGALAGHPDLADATLILPGTHAKGHACAAARCWALPPT